MPKLKRSGGGARRKKIRGKNIGTEWQVQTAKARFSEVFRRARTEGPQLIIRQGKEGANGSDWVYARRNRRIPNCPQRKMMCAEHSQWRNA